MRWTKKTKGTARQKTIGKTDLVNGIELKTVSNSKNLNRKIESDLRNTKHKKGFKTCHFDAAYSPFSDKEIQEVIEQEAKKMGVKRVIFIGNTGEMHVIRH